MNITDLKRICAAAAPGTWSNRAEYIGCTDGELGCEIYSSKGDGFYNMTV